MKIHLAMLISFGALGALLAAISNSAQQRPPLFSANASPVWDALMVDSKSAPRAVEVDSPDHDRSVSTAYDPSNGSVTLSVVPSGTQRLSANIGPSVGFEIGWSPDARAFFVTTSDEGVNGRYKLFIFFIGKKSLELIDVNPVIETAFGHPVACGTPELPNIAGVRWLDGSKELFVVAEIINHSNCDSAGTFRGYEISLPKVRIVKEYGQLEAKQKFWRDMGTQLQNARDNCITDPKTCEVSSNHPDSK